MAITTHFTYKVDDGFEQYAFKSNVNPDQHHFIDRNDGEEWMLGIVQLEESLTAEQVQELRLELSELHEFMTRLKERPLQRRTQPGQPLFEEAL